MTARPFPASFCLTSEGDILIARGDRNVQRWDGLASAIADAGVPTPPTAVVIAGSSTGTIVGVRFAFQRWLDARGNVSNVSAVSNAVTLGSSKTVAGASNAAPIVITSTAHGYSNGSTVWIDGCIGNSAANGVWVIANVATDTFELVGSMGNGAYGSGGSIRQGVGQIDYSSVDAPSDSRVVRRQILRNKQGDVNTFYVDVDSTNLVDTTFASTNTDAQLTVAVPLIDSNGNDLSVERYAEPPNFKRFIVQHKARTWLCGQLEYREGNVSVTNGSPTVTGIDTAFTAAMDGWYLYVDGATTAYEVSSLTGQVLTLASNYAGTTNPYARYALVPPLLNSAAGAERRTIYFSEAGLPEAFNLNYALTVPEEKDAGEITGLVSYGKHFYVLFDRLIKLIGYSVRPQEDAMIQTPLYRGAVNHRVIAEADGLLYILDRRGVYIFGGNYDEDISKPVRPLFDGTAENLVVNWRDVRYFHAAHFAEDHTIKFFCVMSDGLHPYHAICYHYRQKRWWLEEYPVPILSSCQGRLNGRQVVFLGTSANRMLVANRTSLDGVTPQDSGTLRGTVTAATLVTLTDTAVGQFVGRIVGLSVTIVSGRGAGQRRIISAATSTTLTVKTEWLVIPDSTSVYQIAGISWRWRTGHFRWLPDEGQAARRLHVNFRPETLPSHLEAKTYLDAQDEPEVFGRDDDTNGITLATGEPQMIVDTTKPQGYVEQELSSTRGFRVFGGYRVRVEVSGVTNATRTKVYGVTVEGASK